MAELVYIVPVIPVQVFLRMDGSEVRIIYRHKITHRKIL